MCQLQEEGCRNEFPSLEFGQTCHVDDCSDYDSNRLAEIQEVVLVLGDATFLKEEVVLGVVEGGNQCTSDDEETKSAVDGSVHTSDPYELQVQEQLLAAGA